MHKASLLAKEQAQMAAMTRRWSQLEGELQDQVELFVRRVQMDGLTPGQLQSRQFQLDRYRSLLNQVRGQLDQYAGYADGLIRDNQADYGRAAVRAAEQAIQATGSDVGIQIAFDRLPVEAIENMVGLAGDGSPLRSLLEDSFGAGADGMLNQLIRATTLGQNPQVTARAMLRDGLSQSLSRMMTIARTEQLRTHRQASQAAYKISRVVTSYKRLSAHDSRVCAGCLAADGMLVDLETSFAAHPNCVVGETTVSTPSIRGTSKRLYNGIVFDIITTGGNHLTITPNHPVLTDHGWIAAGVLKVGDSVVSSRNSNWPTVLVGPDNQYGPAMIEDIVASFGESLNVSSVRVPVSAVDFHGDVANGDVAIIGSNRFLVDRSQSPVEQPFAEDDFLGRCVRCGSLYADGATAKVFPSALGSPNGILSDFNSSNVLFMRDLGGSQSVGGSMISNCHIGKIQPTPQYGAHGSVFFSQGFLGFTGQVPVNNFIHRERYLSASAGSRLGSGDAVSINFASEQTTGLQLIAESLLSSVPFSAKILHAFARNIFLDSIIQVSSRYFSGHVYNLETDTGWYVANNIITHNCRCTTIPVVQGLPPVTWKSSGDWLGEQSEATQRKILGAGRFELYRQGVPLSDMMAVRTSDTWGDAIVPATLAEIRGRTGGQ